MKKIIQSIAGFMILALTFKVNAIDTVPIFYIDAKDKTGTEIGTTLGKAIKDKWADIEKKYDAYLSQVVEQEQFDEWLSTKIRFIIPNIDKAYQDEVNALVSNWEISHHDQIGDGYLSLNEFWLLQLMADIGNGPNGSGFGVFGSASTLGSPIVGRNLDWKTTEELRSLQAITVYNYEDRIVVNIGFAGFLGVITGFNSDGLFVAYFDSPLGIRYPPPPRAEHAVVFDLRKALETKTKISSAARLFTNRHYDSSHNILFADKKTVKVLEQPLGLNAYLRTDRSSGRIEMSWHRTHQIAVVDCFVLRGSPANCIHSIDRYQWHRFRSLAQFDSSHSAYVKDIINIMFDTFNSYQEIFNKNTVQSMVFTPADKRLYLYTVPPSGIHDATPLMKEVSLMTSVPETPISYFSKILFIIGFLLLIGIWIYGNYPFLMNKIKNSKRQS
jgi:hypothetical protein